MLQKEAHLSASTLDEVTEGHPSCLHTTLASSVLKPRSQAFPKTEPLSTSSLPSHWLEPPCSLTVTAFAVEWKMRKRLTRHTIAVLLKFCPVDFIVANSVLDDLL